MIIKYEKDTVAFFEKNAVCIEAPNQKYYFFPYYLMEIGDGVFEELDWYELPIDLQEQIQRIREKEPTK